MPREKMNKIFFVKDCTLASIETGESATSIRESKEILSRILFNYYSGFLVNTPEGRSLKLRNLLQNPHLREELGKNGKQGQLFDHPAYWRILHHNLFSVAPNTSKIRK